MPVCMVVHNNYHHEGRVRRYAEALAAAGMPVDVLCLKGERSRLKRTEGINVITIPLQRKRDGRLRQLYEYGIATIFFVVKVLSLWWKRRYEVIHVHNMPDFLVVAGLIPRLFGAKLILDIHDPMPEFYQSKFAGGSGGLPVRMLQIQERISAGVVDAVIAANPAFKQNLVKRGVKETNVHIIRNIPDPEIFKRARISHIDSRRHSSFTLIYPGTIAPRYGLEVAIRGLARIVVRTPDVRLLIMGPRVNHVEALIELAERLGVAPWIAFHEPVPIHEVPEFLLMADVGIYPALPDPHMSIATPTKVLEYAAMGLPIVASRLDAVTELLGESGAMLFDPGDADQFAQCVLKLYSDPKRGRDLVEKADRVLFSKCSWRDESRRYFKLLGQLAPPLATLSAVSAPLEDGAALITPGGSA